MRFAKALAPLFAAALIGLTGCASNHDKEVPVALTDVPAAVRATLERETQGGKITEVEREVKNGRTIYSADTTINGVDWDIAVAEDGTLISKEREGADEKK
jgi:hypothetical protein